MQQCENWPRFAGPRFAADPVLPLDVFPQDQGLSGQLDMVFEDDVTTNPEVVVLLQIMPAVRNDPDGLGAGEQGTPVVYGHGEKVGGVLVDETVATRGMVNLPFREAGASEIIVPKPERL